MAAMVQSCAFRRLVQISLCFLFISISLVKPDDEQKHVLDAEMFEKAVNDKAHFIMFFAPWCGHCKRLQPTWNELAEKYNNDEDSQVNLGKVDCTVETALCSEYGVTGYPTLKFFSPGEEVVKYQGKRDAETLEKFMKETLDPSTREEEPEVVAAGGPPEAKDGLYELNVGNFDKHVAKGSHFVKFYAPWCGHCKRLAPTWEELAKETDGKVTINKIDCTSEKSVCDKFEVRGYPTLLFIKDGQKLEKYSGARDLDTLKKYVEAMNTLKKDEPKPEKVEKKTEEKKDDEEKPSKVVQLGEDSFETAVGTGITFVKFYAPWCGHCKRLAPTWDELADKVADKANIKIAKVDCTVDKDVCKNAEVRGYPTLILYNNGKKVDDYNKARELDALYSYVTEQPHDEL